MIRQEHEPPILPGTHDQQNVTLDNKNGLDKNILPHGAAPETHALLRFAWGHKEILDIVDSLDKRKKRIVNPTIDLLYVYYFNDVSLRDLSKDLGGGRTANGKRMLAALEVIWQNVPPEIQSQYPKEKAVKLKENQSNSPRILEKRKETLVALWKDEDYRKKRLEELSNRKNNPGFIQKMRDVRKGDPSPMEGKTHSDTTIAKISKTAQEIWNKRHGIEDIHEPLEKRNLLFAEWLRITQLLQRYPTSFDIKKLREQEKTKFSKTMYNREFGDGNFTRAKQVLDSLTRTIAFLNELQKNPYNIVNGRVFEEDIKQIASTITETIQEIFSSSSTDELKKRATELEEGLEAFKEQLKVKARKKHQITSRIGANESSIWQYVKEQNLRDKMVQAGKITEQEVDMVENYFEKKIIKVGLTVETFDKFIVAVAKAA